MKRFLLKTFDEAGFSDSALIFSQKGHKVELKLEYKLRTIIAEDEYPFLALNKIRMELERQGIKLLCNGSRIDVYPSGMALNSLKAYELKMGEPARKLLNILEPTEEIDKIATINEQETYWERWLNSPKGGNVST